jgi:hypothetical protein
LHLYDVPQITKRAGNGLLIFGLSPIGQAFFEQGLRKGQLSPAAGIYGESVQVDRDSLLVV